MKTLNSPFAAGSDLADRERRPADARSEAQPPPTEQRRRNQTDDSPEQTGGETGPQTAAPSGLKPLIGRHPVASAIVAMLIAVAIAGGIVWWLHARNYESSDDAFIDTRTVLISPQVSGAITSVNVTDNQVVKAGDLLATIDQRDYKAAVDQAAAQIRQAQASIADIEAQIGAQQAQIQQANQQVQEAQAAYNFSVEENQRYQELVQKGAGTVQRAQQAESDFRSKKAALDAANAAKLAADRQVDVLRAKAEQAKAQLQAAQAQKEQADANLQRTQLRAPTDGRIAKLTGAVGALASPGQAIMVLVPLDVWVTANFKETQLELMRVGQPVDIHIDAYDKSYPGHVNSIQAGSGTAFSLLPAENATGNYVKVVQRIPVKITFDQPPDVELGPGMSVVPTVTVRP
ncbi:HlyD family secretion protein [Rhodopseudomonas palustris]|uniref:HlyD family secretion protein n=1 Tax=Rhodopseudomonas palustris TaxID=1076 RepID=A0A323UB43_RHOPL|nr:HlyD family secretion protein [Rhodopseudomonas palustris]PZA10072.1 HlyD family secretion protein [Rhodopseudomonas palustris]